ncbi:MAG: TolC family protein, partial [Bacteroidota bacterium]
INELLDRPLDTEVTVTDSLGFTELPTDRNAMQDAIRASHPMVRMFALQQAVSEEAIALNRLQGKPSFGVGMDYIMVNKRSDVPELKANGRDIIQLRASVKIPLNKTKYDAKEREERLNVEVLETKKSAILSRFNAAIDRAYTDHEMARRQLALYQQQITLTKAAINILQTQYSASGNKFDELLRLEKDLIDYELKIMKAIVKSHLAKAAIEKYLP